MNCSTCDKAMVRVQSKGNQGKFIIFDLESKNEFGNFTTSDGIVVEAFLCTSCGEYKFKAPKQ